MSFKKDYCENAKKKKCHGGGVSAWMCIEVIVKMRKKKEVLGGGGGVESGRM